MNQLKSHDFTEILDVILAFYEKRDYFDLLNTILVKMMDITNADGGTLYVLDEGKLHFRIIRNLSQNIYLTGKDHIDNNPIPLDQNNVQNISAYAALNNEIISIDDVYNNTEFDFEGPKKYDSQHNYKAKSMLVFPLSASGDTDSKPHVIGVIQLINSVNPDTKEIQSFGDIYNPPILPALSNIAANALANILYVKEIQDLFNSFVRVMTKAIDERSPYNVNHTNNVAKYVKSFTGFLNEQFDKKHPLYFDKHRQDQLVMAAYLHDIGKLVTPLEIMDKSDRLGVQFEVLKLKLQMKKQQTEIDFLKGIIPESQYSVTLASIESTQSLMEYINKAPELTDDDVRQVEKLKSLTYIGESGIEERIFTDLHIDAMSIRTGTLTDAERKIMQDHVCVTERLLAQISFNSYYKDVPVWAIHHHEFSDGSGYPHQLKGSCIQPEESILSIIDIFDALTARDRPYKKVVSVQEAIEYLCSLADSGKLPKELVDLFVQSRIWENRKV